MNREARAASADESVAAMEGLVSKEEIEKVRDKVQPKADETPKPREEPRQEAPVQEPKPEDKKEPIVVDTPFGKKTIGEQADVVMETLEDVQKFAKDYGFEINDVKDFKKVFDQYKELNNKAQEGEQYKQQYEQYDNIFKSFPEEVSAVVYAHLNGQDYREVLKTLNSPIDYSKPFDEHGTLNLVNQYSENNFDKETWDELDESMRKSLVNMAKRSYQNEQVKYKETLTKPQKTAEEFQKKFSKSVDESITQLRSTYPDMDKSQIERVRQLMVNDLHGSLFNPDNTYRNDAAVKVAMQEFGPSTISKFEHTLADVVAMHERRGESKAHEQLISRSDKPDETGRNVADRTQEVSQYVDQMTSFLNK